MRHDETKQFTNFPDAKVFSPLVLHRVPANE
jgi:hypothetical protein